MKKEIPELKKLELNPENVMQIFAECRPDKNTQKVHYTSFYSEKSKRKAELMDFDMHKLYAHAELFRYWLGQIKGVHQKRPILITSDGLFNYKGEKWIKDNDNTPLFALYYLSTGARAFPRFIDGKKYAETKDLPLFYQAGLKPTYPPSDPNFKLVY